MLSAKWQIMLKNICKQNDYDYNKLRKLCVTRFMTHFSKSINVLLYDLEGIYELFTVLADSKNGAVSANSRSWRIQWQSIQFVLMLIIQVDSAWGFDLLSTSAQKTVNTAPGYRTYYYIKSETAISRTIDSLEKIKKIISAFEFNQFNPNYQLETEIKSESILFENLYLNIHDIINYEYKSFKLNTCNLFSNYQARCKLPPADAAKLLTEEEFKAIYGSETDDDETDMDDDSDYEPEMKEEENVDLDDDEQMQIRDTIDRNNVDWTEEGGDVYLYQCGLGHGDHQMQCKCGGWICNQCIKNKYNVAISKQESESLVYFCGNCVSALTDTMDINLNHMKSFKNDFFSNENKAKWSETSVDESWYGCSLDYILD